MNESITRGPYATGICDDYPVGISVSLCRNNDKQGTFGEPQKRIFCIPWDKSKGPRPMEGARPGLMTSDRFSPLSYPLSSLLSRAPPMGGADAMAGDVVAFKVRSVVGVGFIFSEFSTDASARAAPIHGLHRHLSPSPLIVISPPHNSLARTQYTK